MSGVLNLPPPTRFHLTIVFAALAVNRRIEEATVWSIKKFVKTARRYRTIHIRVGDTPSPPPSPARRPARHAA
jgi:hypothetical protein